MLHPAPLVACALLLLNDHVLKRAAPSWVTGKLSDFAGLLFFPLLLQALWELLLARRGAAPSARVLAFAAVATGVVFTLAKVWPSANHVVRDVDGWLRWLPRAAFAAARGADAPAMRRPSMVLDATDLIALPVMLALCVPVTAATRGRPRTRTASPGARSPSRAPCRG